MWEKQEVRRQPPRLGRANQPWGRGWGFPEGALGSFSILPASRCKIGGWRKSFRDRRKPPAAARSRRPAAGARQGSVSFFFRGCQKRPGREAPVMAQADVDAGRFVQDEQPGWQESPWTRIPADRRLSFFQAQENVQMPDQAAASKAGRIGPFRESGGCADVERLPDDPFGGVRRPEEADGMDAASPPIHQKRDIPGEGLRDAGHDPGPRRLAFFLPARGHAAGEDLSPPRFQAPVRADPDALPSPPILRSRLHGGLPGCLLGGPERPEGGVRISGRTNGFPLFPQEDLFEEAPVPALPPVRRVHPVDNIVPHKGQGFPPPSGRGFR